MVIFHSYVSLPEGSYRGEGGSIIQWSIIKWYIRSWSIGEDTFVADPLEILWIMRMMPKKMFPERVLSSPDTANFGGSYLLAGIIGVKVLVTLDGCYYSSRNITLSQERIWKQITGGGLWCYGDYSPLRLSQDHAWVSIEVSSTVPV